MYDVKVKLEELKDAMKKEGILGSDTQLQILNQYLVDELEKSILDDEAHKKNVNDIKDFESKFDNKLV